MYGEDKTTIDELKNTVAELEKLKIEITEKSNNTNELNNLINEMEGQINQADDKMLNTEQFAKTGNETTEDEQNAVNEETTSNTENEIVFNEGSNVDVLMDNIDTLVNKINEQVKAETERKAEEERKKQEQNILNGDLSAYAGTYVSKYPNTGITTLTLNKNGSLQRGGITYTLVSASKNTDGAYELKVKYWSDYDVANVARGWNYGIFTLAPIGVNMTRIDENYKDVYTNINEIRIKDDMYDDPADQIVYIKK